MAMKRDGGGEAYLIGSFLTPFFILTSIPGPILKFSNKSKGSGMENPHMENGFLSHFINLYSLILIISNYN